MIWVQIDWVGLVLLILWFPSPKPAVDDPLMAQRRPSKKKHRPPPKKKHWRHANNKSDQMGTSAPAAPSFTSQRSLHRPSQGNGMAVCRLKRETTRAKGLPGRALSKRTAKELSQQKKRPLFAAGLIQIHPE